MPGAREEGGLGCPHPTPPLTWGPQSLQPAKERSPKSRGPLRLSAAPCLSPWPLHSGLCRVWLAKVEPEPESKAAAPRKTWLFLGLRGPGPREALPSACWGKPWSPLPPAPGLLTISFVHPFPSLHTLAEKVTSGSRISASGQRWSPTTAGRPWTISTAPQARAEEGPGGLRSWVPLWVEPWAKNDSGKGPRLGQRGRVGTRPLG